MQRDRFLPGAVGCGAATSGLAARLDLTCVRVEVEEVVNAVAAGDGVPEASGDEAGDGSHDVNDLGFSRHQRQGVMRDDAIGQAVAGIADAGQVEQTRILADGECLGVAKESMIEL
jgi:hypothetical protein